ncbi:hypothetical protein [Wenyingzhuangia sp. IMCC45467]
MDILSKYFKNLNNLTIILCFFSTSVVFTQEQNKDSNNVASLKIDNSIFIKPRQTKAKEINDFETIKRMVVSSAFIKGYHYSFNLNQVEDILPVKQINNLLRIPNKSLFNSSLFKNTNTDIQFKSYVNMNGAAQIITFKGVFFSDYNGNYTLQISYRLSPNDYNINIPNLIKQEVQNGLALKLKINLENGTK